MDQKDQSMKKSRQKLESLINKGGIKTDSMEYHEDLGMRPKAKSLSTHSLLTKEQNTTNKGSSYNTKNDKQKNHILFKNAEELGENFDGYYLNKFDMNNNQNNYSKELVQVEEESSESSSGDEKISRAFGIERSLTMTPKVKSYQFSNSFGPENPEIEKSMLTDELRMLSFLNEDEDELTTQFEAQKNKFKNRLKKNGLINNTQTKNLKNFELNPNRFVNSQRKKETSMFSTQDSKKHFSNSFTHKHNSFNNQNHSAHLTEIVDSEIHVQELNSDSKNNSKPENYNNIDAEPQFPVYSQDQQSHIDSQTYNMYCNPIQHDPNIFYNYYIPNIDMHLIRRIRKPDNINGLGESDYSNIDSDMAKAKKGKRNYLKVADSSEYVIDTSQIETVKKTTLMIRNIPNKYTKELMLETIDEEFHDAYDFFYLPIDFKNNCNVGYAFINFKELQYIKPFFEKFNMKKWAHFKSEKICEIKYARIQGKTECEEHFKDSSLMKQPVS